MPCGIVFRSVGYRGVPLPGVPFDERSGTIPNEGGRVEPGIYVAGWIKRGPSGVIGTNKKDATETIALLLEDARAGALPARGEGTLEELLEARGVEAVMYAGWDAIDRPRRRRASRTAGRGSSSAAGTSCSKPPRAEDSQVTDCYKASLESGVAPLVACADKWVVDRSQSSASAAARRGSSCRDRGGARKREAARGVSTWAGPTRRI